MEGDEMRYCTHCGSPVQPGSSFCARCGARLSASGPAASDGFDDRKDKSRPPRRSHAPLWIALIVLLAALAVPVAILLPKYLAEKQAPVQTPYPTAADEPDLEPVYAAAAPYENEDGTVAEEQVQEAIDAVYEAALSNPDVISCEKDEYGVYMEVAEGPDFVYCPTVEGMDAGGGPLRIVTLQPFDTENRENARRKGWNLDLDAPDDVAKALSAEDDRWVFAADLNDGNVTMDRILSLSNYQVILWHGHGGYSKSSGYYLCTEVDWSGSLAERYGLNKSNCYRYDSGGKVGLRPAFFDQHFADNAFDNAFIYLATCYSGKEEAMAQTLLDKGAAVVFVNSESIYRDYNLDMLHLISDAYLVGPAGETAQAAIRYLGAGYSYNSPENWTIGDSLALAQFRYGNKDPGKLFNRAEVFYRCRPGMERTPYSEWIKGFLAEEEPSRLRQGLSDLSLTVGSPQYADVDFDGLQDLVTVTGSSRLTLRVDFGSGESWEAELRVDADGETPAARLLSFTDGEFLCYAFIADNPGSKYGGLSWALFGQDYLAGASPVALNTEASPALEAWGGVYDGKWVVVAGTRPGGSLVYSIPEPLYSDLLRMAVDYGEPLLPIPSADGMCYEIYPTPRGDGMGYGLVISRSCSSPLGYVECPGTVYASYYMRSASQAALAQAWFKEDPYFLEPLSGVMPDMVSSDLLSIMPSQTGAVADGQYWAILYAEDDAYGSHVSSEVDLEDYMCFSYEEIAALRVGDTLEMSRFIPIWMIVSYRAYGYFSDGYMDIPVESIEREYNEWFGDLLYINSDWGQVCLQDWNGCWRVIVPEHDYIPMQHLRTVTLPIASGARILDYWTAVMFQTGDSVIEWEDPYDYFAFNPDMPYFEAKITVENGVITEIVIPYRP